LPERHDPKAGLRPEPEHRVSSRVKPNEEVCKKLRAIQVDQGLGRAQGKGPMDMTAVTRIVSQ